MSLDNRPVYTGGCQCGAVRFRAEGTLGKASICHCRMCQKAFGSFYAPLVGTKDTKFAWTRGEPARFRSSNAAMRGFCRDCGTPLTYETERDLDIAIGAFDDPSLVVPEIQFGIESKIPYVDRLAALPTRHTLDDLEDAPFLPGLVSYQHPDHDTDEGTTA